MQRLAQDGYTRDDRMKPYYQEDAVTIYQGDCIEIMRELPADFIDAVVTDPPYGIRFTGEAWDGADIAKRQEWGKETSPVPDGVGGPNGGYRSLAAEAGRYDRSLKASVAFVDWCRQWATECYRLLKPGGHLLAFGSPRRYHQLGMGIELAGLEVRDSIAWLFGQGFPKSLDVAKTIDKKLGGERKKDAMADATTEPRAWAGWGTALKPAFEPCIVARKPLAGTVADNVLAYGTGALNIDATRVHVEGSDGRWTPNVALDEGCATELDRQAGTPTDSPQSGIVRHGATTGRLGRGSTSTVNEVESGPSRFFPAFRYEAKACAVERPKVGGVQHPTVKPLKLMRWLTRLVAPHGATILEPFAGSGTTVEACIAEGMRCIAIERETGYLPLIMNRISKPIDIPLSLGDTA